MANIILLHGAIGSIDQMSKIQALLAGNHQVMAYNFPEHGKDDASMPEFNIPLFTAFIEEKIKLIEGPVHILGYSLGGYVGLILAHSNPTKVKSVMTFGTIFQWDEAQALKQCSMIDPDKIEQKVPDFANHLKNIHGLHWKNVLLKTQGLLKNLGAEPVLTEQLLSEISQNILISVGDKDALVSIEESWATQKKIKQAALSVFPDCGHDILKAPSKYIVEQFEVLISKG